ncbi:hypothetical protein ONS95_014991 [Cadophora gregata]|uniref:uncharacterized protein n=1 Tax=Cadophora gregata TaxID=51156 RepID=UPI0026DB9D1C|nr:uncharacterized protein ONS95_014991 [Cadophora gregata]KAK0103195.1 hypothetical protein ONS96_005800 [Cadophora gregata f. sp. sojae]KAK0113298.1 hypothetical protein ONS95_014991 [Cadophora gregata]
MSPGSKPVTGRRTVCDHCRRRRIRCDGEFPCNQCGNASLTCKREHVPKRRGPKRGTGRVINELRAQDGHGDELPNVKGQGSNGSGGSQTSGPPSIDQWISDSTDAISPTLNQQIWHPIMSEPSHALPDEPNSIFTTDQFRPTSPSYLHLIPTCIDLFMEHIYPIMPLVHMPTLRDSITRPLEMYEKNLLYSLCALTSTHMSGKSILAPGPPSWEAAGRFFLDECISVRQSYDFVEDKTLSAVISSYFVSTAFFELNQNRKSWYYLREALTMGQDLGFHDEHTYVGLSPAEALCRRRTFWILYVTERSFAILRHKPLTLQKTPEFPSTLHSYESPEIHSGFMHLVNSYHLLDSSFVDSWNESASAPASTATYTSLQQQLSRPHPTSLSLTSIQKADILVTQQWLRLIVWQSSMRQGLLSSTASEESMTFRYPLKIAHSLLDVISSLPTYSIEVHGMGIFEKIFEIGNTMLDVMQACGTNIPSESYGVAQDPFEVFVKTLSQTPNSQRQYANLLLAKAAEKPEIQRFSMPISAPLSAASVSVSRSEGLTTSPVEGGAFPYISMNTAAATTAASSDIDMQGLPVPRGWRGSIVGEIGEGGGMSLDGVGAGLGLMAPVGTRQWRGSIVGEIGEDGVYKEHEGVNGNGDRDEASNWAGASDPVWTADGGGVVGDDAWLKMEEGII